MSIITERGKEIYERLYPFFLPYAGQFVAIETDSEDFFVGDTLDDAIEQARSKYPDKEFYCVQIGRDSLFSFANKLRRIKDDQ